MSSTSQIVLTLGVAIISASSALAGSVLAPLLGAKASHRIWLRDKRAEQCERFHAVMVEAREDAHLGQAREGRTGHLLPSDHTHDLMTRFRNQASGLGLYVSKPVAQDAMSLWSEYQAVAVSRLFPEEKERSDAFLDRFDTLAAEVESALRVELGVD